MRDFSKRVLFFRAAVLIFFIMAGCTVSSEALEMDGEVLTVYKNLVLIRKDGGNETVVLVEKDASLKGLKSAEKLNVGDYVSVEYDKEVQGIRHAVAVTLEAGIELPQLVTEISTDELHVLISGKKDYILVDVRRPEAYGLWHIPSAVSLTFEELEKMVAGKKDRLIVFYAENKRDPLSVEYARKAASLGYRNVKLHSGIINWVKDGYYVIVTVNSIKKMAADGSLLVFVDTRSPEKVKEAHIPGAINIQPGEMKDDDIMRWSVADPIVFYGEDNNDPSAAWNALIAANWGYAIRSGKPVMHLDGGFRAWKGAALPVSSGVLKTSVPEPPRTFPEVILFDDFRNLWQKKFEDPDRIFLDVRSRLEFEGFRLRDVLNIPVDELPYRIAEVPKTKEIIVFCSVGTRSRIAYYILKENGYNARYLNRRPMIELNGTIAH